jgi:hypothetical protein
MYGRADGVPGTHFTPNRERNTPAYPYGTREDRFWEEVSQLIPENNTSSRNQDYALDITPWDKKCICISISSTQAPKYCTRSVGSSHRISVRRMYGFSTRRSASQWLVRTQDAMRCIDVQGVVAESPTEGLLLLITRHSMSKYRILKCVV